MLLRALLAFASPAGARARLSILIFHRVLPQADPLFPEEVTRVQFDRICGWLRAWCHVLPLGEAVDRLRARTLPARAAVITFDDGYADNHAEALPVLRRHGLTATFFVATGFLDGGRMWNDTLIEAIRRCPSDRLDLRGTPAESAGPLVLGDAATRRRAIDAVLAVTKYLEPNERERCVQAIADRCAASLPDDLMMTSPQVRDLVQQGMTVGAHTVHHPILARLDRKAIRREIAESRAALERITGRPIDLFAYPNGKPGVDYNERAVAVVRELGFRAAVSTRWGAGRAGDDLFELPRFSPWDRSRTGFGVRLAENLLRR